MPAVAGGGGGDELGPGDEIKVFKDEGEDENEQNASESLQAELLEEKSSLITESEQFSGKLGELRRPEAGHPLSVPGFPSPFGMGYLVSPYAAYANGAMGRGTSPLSPFFSDPLGSPPPAHMGSLPYDKATMAAAALRPPLYALPHQYPYSHLGMEQLAAWHRSPYSIPLSTASPMSRFSHSSGIPLHHPQFPFGQLHPHHLPHIKQEYGDRPPHLIHHDDKESQSPKKKEPHIKKPLNAFMLYMKEMRPVVQAECTLKESAAINQILGRRWHGLTREEQAKYYEKARQERQRHMQMYPHWNARDNYRYGQKKKKRKRDKNEDPAANMKKCRARYGLDQQNLWCKPCRRKKKCIRVQMYLAGRSEQEIEATTFDEEGEAITPTGLAAGNHNDNGSSHGSDGEAGSPSGSVESSEHSITSPNTPGGGMSLPSIGSPASIMSPATPGGECSDWGSYRVPSHQKPPVGSDPRDTNNPLSISSLTSRDIIPSPSSYSGHHSDKLLGVI